MGAYQSSLDHEDADPRLHLTTNKSDRPNLRKTRVSGARPFELDEEEDDDHNIHQQHQDLGNMEVSRNHGGNRRPSNTSSHSREREQATERDHSQDMGGHMAWSNNHPSTRRRSSGYSSHGLNLDFKYDRMDIQEDDVGRAHDGSRESFANHQQSQDDNEASDPELDSLFIPENDDRSTTTAGIRVINPAQDRPEPPRRFSHDAPKRMTNFHRHPARRPSPPLFEPNIGSNRRSSRYSGMKSDNWHVNKFREPVNPHLTLELPGRAPFHLQREFQSRRQQYDEEDYDGMCYRGDGFDDDERMYGYQSSLVGRHPSVRSHATSQTSFDGRARSPVPAQSQHGPKTRIQKVSRAALHKRGLKEGQEEEVLQRGYGVNDPENVEIVNMKETGDFSFEDIARILNDKRLSEGRDPKLTTTGVNGRYNRTAPTLFESQGLHFVSLIERKRNPGAARMHGKPIGEVGGEPQDLWNANEHDKILVDAVREYNAEKWRIVADKVAEKTGLRFPENQLAKRFVLL